MSKKEFVLIPFHTLKFKYIRRYRFFYLWKLRNVYLLSQHQYISCALVCMLKIYAQKINILF